MEANLFAVTGPLKGAIFRLHEEEVSVGRHVSNQLSISDLSVSRHHCVIKPEGGRYKIVDLGSNNGTYVNGNQVEECILNDGDKISIGDTAFTFVTVDEDSSGYRIVIPGDQEDVATTATIQLGDVSLDLNSSPKRMPDLDVFTTLGRVLNEDLPLENLCEKIFQTLDQAIPLECGAILLVGRGTDDPPSTLGWDKRVGPSSSVRISRPIIDQLLTQAQPVLGRNLPIAERRDTQMAVPLSVRNKLRGLIYLESGRPTRTFTDDDLEFVTMFSGYIGLAIESARRLEHIERAEQRSAKEFRVDREMVGESVRMRLTQERILRIAATEATVLIRGETGTGKELAARAIHQNSARCRQPFETVNCALLKDNLLESELFGHEKGAFTGAATQKKGRFEVADGGTMFLDEVGELPEPTQSMLLRVLQERTFHRLGGTRLIEVDIRVIAATNKDLEKAVKEGTFRSDLYYRLNVVSVVLPTLRERREDIPSLVELFLRRYSAKNKRVVRKVSPAAMTYLQAYAWPGNVRELENAIEYAIVFGFTGEIQPEDLPERIVENAIASGSPPIQYRDAVKEAKKEILLKALRDGNNNYGQAAKLLDIHVNNLHRLIRELELKPRAQRGKEEA